MIGFHIDMNMAHYRVDYLRAWLAELARLGYDTVVWEIENSVAWETCPECAAPDAISKDELSALLAESRLLGLRPVPLLQTLGHVEYVLKHDAYRGLRELPDRIDQYCPRNPDVLPLLHRWIDEYLEVFGPVEYFHLGADESMCLGCCPTCRSYADEYSLSRLYVDHVNAVAKPLIKKGITPIVWADMVLACPDALDELGREILLFDWRYDIYRGCDRICVWPRVLKREGEAYTFGQPMITPSELTEEERARYGAHLFPSGSDSEPEEFYTADFLADKGFKVVTCPSSSHFGDNVFSPRD
ncbi:MAG: family 20 glycosylhydrolase, partial [Chitinivibrionales bacterium]|nr:family 20 glycosylhydrolase [Chitinivibrionales bacterium]